MIDPRLHVLRMLAAHGTVTATAKALHFTPSAVSHQLRTLAEDLDVVLLVPQGRGVRLTPAARILLSHVDALFSSWEHIRGLLAAESGSYAGSLRICGFSTAAAALLPAVVTALRASRPALEVRIIEADPAECLDLLLADDADLAVIVSTEAAPSSADSPVETHFLLDDPLELLVPAGHPLASRPDVGLGETADQQWIVDRLGRPHRQLVFNSCAEAGFTPTVAHEAVEWDTAAALVAAGFGVCLVPRLARLPSGYPIVRVPLRGDPAPSRHIRTVVRRGSGSQPVLAEALEVLTRTAAAVPRLA
jgi:DNA-binding transcriptional LysR family regulator